MLNKDNYVPWSSHLLRYEKSKPNKKLLVNSILHILYVRRMIVEPGDPNHTPLVAESTHEQTDDELTKKKENQMEADDQEIQTILMDLPEDIYAAVDSCDTAQEIWLHVEQMLKGFDIGAQEKKDKLFNEWEKVDCRELEQNGNGNIIATRDEGNGNGNNSNQIRCYNCRGLDHYARNCTVRPRRRDSAYLQTQLLIAQKEEAVIELQAEEFDLVAAAASTLGTQTDKAPVYDSDGLTKNDNNVSPKDSNMEHSGEIVEQHPDIVEETRAFFESLYNNLVIEFVKVNTANCKMKEANVDLTTKLARYKGQEKSFKFNQAKFDELENAKTITTLNEEITNLNNQLLKEKSTVSYLEQEKEKLKSDFKTREDELLDKLIQS
ncbi:retrovirus-related pol polyprotein from transposon TNT 1-94 [Tanacetum coccineum]